MIFKQNNTAQDLYNYIEEKAKLVNVDLPCTKDALIAYATMGRGEIDCIELMNLDNLSFCEAFYLLSFNIQPTKAFYEQWKEKAEILSREEFRKVFVESFTKRPDFSTFHVKLYNCVYLTEPQFDPEKLYDLPELNGLAFIYLKLKPFYLKLPLRVRLILKKLFRNMFFK